MEIKIEDIAEIVLLLSISVLCLSLVSVVAVVACVVFWTRGLRAPSRALFLRVCCLCLRVCMWLLLRFLFLDAVIALHGCCQGNASTRA